MELIAALWIAALAASVTVWEVRTASAHHLLQLTRDRLVWDLRWAEQKAIAAGQPTMVRLAMYNPYYSVYVGPTLVSWRYFEPGVNYKDGYLQMVTGRITYSPQGTSQVGGVIRLQAAGAEADVLVFMHSGLVGEADMQ